MKISLLIIGKTDEAYLKEGIQKYVDRLKHYCQLEITELHDVKLGKKANAKLQKDEEGKILMDKLKSNDFVVLLDEKGKEYTSVEMANYLQKRMNGGTDIVFIVGGPFGFSERIYERANSKLALSKLTFSHQMVRLFFVEQLYRSFTILKGEKYHHL